MIRRAFLGLAVSMAFMACGEDTRSTFSESTADGGLADGGSRYSIRPADYPRDCATDADCVLLESIIQCGRCCGEVSVRRGQVEVDHAAVENACQQGGGPRNGICGMYCGEGRAACFEGGCVRVKLDGGV